MVYAFRVDGTVASAPWEKVVFTIGTDKTSSAGSNTWELRGLMLAEDGETVVDAFAVGVKDDTSRNFLLAHWEFIRSYMEDGPEQLTPRVGFLWPIDGRKEDWRTSYLRLMALFITPGSGSASYLYPLEILGAIISFPMVLARRYAMSTSKIPVWPQEIEATCTIEPNDPYAKDSSTNPRLPPSVYDDNPDR
jgi:hypothetical protein